MAPVNWKPFPHDNDDHDYEGGLRQRRDLGRRGAHLAAFDEAGQNLFGDPDLVGEDAAQLHLDHMIAATRSLMSR